MTRLQEGFVPFFEQKIQGYFFKDTFPIFKDSNQRLEFTIRKTFVVFTFL